jgi:hypothetical protein
MEGDKANRFLMDEVGQMPLVIKMNGSKFRWDAFKMAYEMQPRRSFDAVKKTAQEIIDWVNNEPAFPPLQNNP